MNIENVKTWRDAVCAVVDNFLFERQCFSSGEVTKIIREERPDFRFSHWDIGQYLRDLYFGGVIEYQNQSNGRMIPATQVPRRTTGLSRTPAGVEVFVYGPSFSEARYHDFEVDIPRPLQDLTDPYDEYGTLDGEGPMRNFDDAKTVATVHADGRLCIPRSAFDKYMHETGQHIAFGDKVYIRLDRLNMKVFVNLDRRAGAKAYDLTRDRGRVKYKPNDEFGWNPGDNFEIFVRNNGLEIDLNETV